MKAKDLILLSEKPPETYRVKIHRVRGPKWVLLGSFDIDATSGKVWNEKYSPKLDRPPDAEDIRAIRASLLAHGDAMAGHYPAGDPFPGTYHWDAKRIGDLEVYKPILHVRTDDWTISGFLVEEPDHGTYIWQFRGLTPEQRRFMSEHGESIYLAMNEGNEFEGKISHYADEEEQPWGEEPEDHVVGRWWVTGQPRMAPVRKVRRWW